MRLRILFVLLLCVGPSIGYSEEIKLDIYYLNTFSSSDMKKEALELVKKMVSENPKDYKYHYTLGVLYIPEYPDLAKEEFKEAIKFNPKHYSSYMNMGYINQTLNSDNVEINSYFIKAIECAPENPVGYNTLATVYLGQGNSKSAYEILEKGINIIKNDESLYFNQSVILFGNYDGKPEQAKIIRNMERSLAITKKDIYYLLIGTYYLRTKENEKAKVAFEKALEIDPNNYMNILSLSTAYKNMNKYDDAISIAKGALKKYPNNELVIREIKWYEQEYELYKKSIKQ